MVDKVTIDAELHAQKQWNLTPCGSVPSNSIDLEYFLTVEKERYQEQDWQLDFFPFDQYLNKKVLEIGIGHGTDLMQFARNGAVCHGVDITEKHLELTAQNFNLQNKSVTLTKTSAIVLPYESNSLDCIYSFGVIHHIPEAHKVLEECYRVLKPGGKIIITNYYKHSAFHYFIKILHDGLIKRRLFSLGYDGLLATIETGADGKNIKPYVKLYSSKEMRSLLKNFSNTEIKINQLKLNHFYPIFLGKIMSPFLKLFSPLMGWYVTAIGIKADES
jgi:ubiquinone/menaquinone biosynthesis C-methylase UbiE